MYVSSYLELYTTLLGWKLYDLSYAVLSELGITLVPFVYIVISKISDGNSAKGDNSGITEEIDTVVTMVIAIVVWITCVIPWSNIQPTNIRFQPTATFGNLAPPVVTAASDTTTYATTFSAIDLGNAEAPLWWGFLGQVSTGMAHAISDNLPLEPSLESLKVALSHDTINNPETRAQYKEFYSKCYTTAKNKYHRLSSQKKLPPEAVAALAVHGPEDLDWPGSRILRATPGLYATCNTPATCGSSLTSRQPVGAAPQLGCDDWWSNLSQDMLLEDGASSSMWADFGAWSGLSNENIEDTRIKNLLNNLSTDDIAEPQQYGNPGWATRYYNNVQNLLATGAVASQALKQNAEKEIMRQVIPMVKSVAVLMLTFVLPFLLVVGMYKIGSIVTLSVVFFSMYFIHALLAVANWVDHFLLTAIAQGYSWIDFVLDPIALGQGRLLIGIVTGSLYIVAPMIWFYGLVFVGVSAGRSANSFVSGMGGGSAAGAGSANLGGGYAKKGFDKSAGAGYSSAKKGYTAVRDKFRGGR